MQGFEVTAIPVATNRSCAVTALKAAPSGMIYAGLTAKTHVLVEIDPATNAVRDCGPIYRIEGDYLDTLDKIHNSLCVGADGKLWIGQGLNIADATPPQFDFTTFPGGHLWSYDPATGAIEDHGIPVPMSAIHAMTIAPAQGMIYGHAIPDHHFWSYDITSGEMKDYGKIGPYPSSHNLQADLQGNCWGSWRTLVGGGGKARFSLLKFDYATRKLIRTSQPLLFGDLPQADSVNWGIDSLCVTREGTIYGGEAGLGLFFRIEPESGQAVYLGKPLDTPRMTGMAEGPDGTIFITAGFPVMHLVSYHPPTGLFRDHGAIVEGHEMCYFHGIAVTDDGTVWTGETDSNRCIVYRCTPTG